MDYAEMRALYDAREAVRKYFFEPFGTESGAANHAALGAHSRMGRVLAAAERIHAGSPVSDCGWLRDGAERKAAVELAATIVD